MGLLAPPRLGRCCLGADTRQLTGRSWEEAGVGLGLGLLEVEAGQEPGRSGALAAASNIVPYVELEVALARAPAAAAGGGGE